ncbi:MAG: AAA family ATPase, partial [Acidimicrobiales bacterium]
LLLEVLVASKTSFDLVKFRNNRLLFNQVLSRIPATSAGQLIHRAAEQVLAALKAVFILDPVPGQMRQYVPRRDALLRSNADNLSAAVASLLEDPEARKSLLAALTKFNEQEVVDMATSASSLDDLMLTVTERFRGNVHQVPARVMSDGTLRFLAILVALAEAPSVEVDQAPTAGEAVGQTTVVIEELENGLHASQVKMLMGIVRDDVKRRRVRALATAHSPIVLEALTGDEHRSVIVCQRDTLGQSTLCRLTELPNYVNIVAGGGPGRAAVDGRLRASEGPPPDPGGLLDRIFERTS